MDIIKKRIKICKWYYPCRQHIKFGPETRS